MSTAGASQAMESSSLNSTCPGHRRQPVEDGRAVETMQGMASSVNEGRYEGDFDSLRHAGRAGSPSASICPLMIPVSHPAALRAEGMDHDPARVVARGAGGRRENAVLGEPDRPPTAITRTWLDPLTRMSVLFNGAGFRVSSISDIYDPERNHRTEDLPSQLQLWHPIAQSSGTSRAKAHEFVPLIWARLKDEFGSRWTYYYELRKCETGDSRTRDSRLGMVQEQIQTEWQATLTFLFVLGGFQATVFGYAPNATLYSPNKSGSLFLGISASATGCGVLVDGYLLAKYRTCITVDDFKKQARSSPPGPPYLFFAIQASLPRALQNISTTAAAFFLLEIVFAEHPVIVISMIVTVLLLFNGGYAVRFWQALNGNGDMSGGGARVD
ncbi:hypothetical protein PENSPDRAFT_659660 [Peniophora sp. CONT]|nr:hypothetical protein PENSPDRAFT_659660 [Peniophora sp. CONT]